MNYRSHIITPVQKGNGGWFGEQLVAGAVGQIVPVLCWPFGQVTVQSVIMV